ncbi:allantoinase AllB [Gorillibacterium massiliense]|uniref:allantoinase AllB n=1 Tax=Gorillibacterium massiliense TaxID=1280390 RepID=UPI0004B8A15A|nr:allantoinase AllB [Gorillibacterium massiliense]
MIPELDRIIRGGQVVLADGVKQLDIGIKDGRIAKLAPSIPSSFAKEPPIEAKDYVVMPGMVDAHVHFNEPGFRVWEGFASGSASLAAGGCTTYIDMPLNGIPPTINVAALHEKMEAAVFQSAVDYAFWGGLVPGNLEEIEGLAAAGVVGFKAFLSDPGGRGEMAFRQADDVTLYEGMKKIAKLGSILALHAESDVITGKLTARARLESKGSALDYAATRPVIAEEEAVNRALFFAERTGCSLHFVHISSHAALKLINAAKNNSLNVTAETCPHYLALTEEDMVLLGGVAKCAPPLRNEREQAKLWEAVETGSIDFIASDHSPCPTELKVNDDYFAIWGGISGAQSSMELMITEGTVRRGIPLPYIAQMLATEPAKRFGLHPCKGEIAVGADADLVLVDMNTGYTLKKEDLLYRHAHSPYIGKTMSCRIKATFCRGMLIYEMERGIVRTGAGEWIRPCEPMVIVS